MGEIREGNFGSRVWQPAVLPGVAFVFSRARLSQVTGFVVGKVEKHIHVDET
ncbi:hypothetical protein [Geobacter argillaceus]|uniref:Uncharacterized protein n=1 Tax=Geobacter argillaceus TaxID=345631 RepID=A0A562VGN9_9BACT|nr:hypothetical protein [Geobacter argillaceus]TWJ17038.1 hypothetical protein JN12_03150 [Geobacter argillaceus]